MSNAFNNAAKLAKTFSLLEPRFGAVVGASNNTTAIQAAITAVEAVNGTLEIPAGTWWASTLTISDNLRIVCPEPAGAILKQIAGTNANFVTIGYAVVQNPIIENITIDGNSANNTSGNGLHLTTHAETDPSVTYGFSVTLRNSYIQNCADRCLYVGTNRNMGHVENTELKRGDSLLYITGSSDWRFVHARFAFPLAGAAVVAGPGADNVFIGCAMYGALTEACVQLTTQSSSPTKLIGCTINYNQRDGLLIQGQTGIARSVGHMIHGCWFAENGLETDNTYSHIKCTDTSGASFIGNNFRYGGSGNKAKYLIETTGVAGYHQWVGNTWDQSSAPYGTAISNNNAYLRLRVEDLAVEGTSYFGADVADLTANSLRVPKGVSGGNYVQINGRASGTGPDISAEGVDGAVVLRASSKGAAAVEIWTNSRSSRAARFMPITSAVNRLDFYPGAIGDSVRIVAASSTDPHVDLSLEPQGTEGCLTIPADGLRNYADDTAAAAGGVPVRGLYHTTGAVKIRLS